MYWPIVWAAIGYAGDAVFVLGHFLLSTDRIKNGTLYQVIQITAAFLLGLSAFMSAFYPTTVLEIIWITISLFAIRGLRKQIAP